MNDINPKFFCVVAQLSHFAWGALVITWVGILCPHQFYYIWGVGELLAAVKEFWYDANYENAETRGSDLVDFLFYTGGAVAAFVGLKLVGMV